MDMGTTPRRRRTNRSPSIRSVDPTGASAGVARFERLLCDAQAPEPGPGPSAGEGAGSRDFSFEIRRDAGAVALVVRGRLDVANATRLGAVLGDLIESQGNLHVLVDLDQATSVDPAGLGVFGAAARVAARRGGLLTVRAHGSQDRPDAVAVVDGVTCPAHDHMVEFYESDEFLSRSVRQFIEPALRGDEAVIVVATRRHRQLFDEALTAAGVDLKAARRAARYVDLDAEDMLARFIVDGAPDPRRFEGLAAGLIAQAGSGGRRVRIYGEMVAVLWADGNVAASIALEDLWNSLGRRHQFSLFCAYPLTAFDREEATAAFRTICEQHPSASTRS